MQNGDTGFPCSTYSLIFTFWCDARKSLFIEAFPMGQKIPRQKAVEHQSVAKGTPDIRKYEVSGLDGALLRIENSTLSPLDNPEGPANMYIYVYDNEFLKK